MPEDESHSDSLSFEQQVKVDLLADQFERDFNARQNPRIAAYLEQVPALRSDLLKELMALEVELRRAVGDQPLAEEYRQRFPGDDQIINAVFGEAPKPATALDSTLDKRPAADDTDTEDPEPERLGRYQIQRRLGRGGFGVVYLAQDPQLGRPVALKVPRRKRFKTPEQAAKFVEEARKVANLKHPAIVTVHDVQEQDGWPFIVQEFIEGQNAAEWATSRKPSYQQIACLMVGVADAVGYAHQQGLIHCDLKLANVLVDTDGRPHVADFGLALHESVQPLHKGEVFGTPAVMAPEQVRGESHRLDGRTDIWAMGVMLYELLVGRKPFVAENLDELFVEIQSHDPKPPRQIDRGIPRELERVCLKCLSKRQTERFNTADDLREDLQAWLDAQPRPESSTRVTIPESYTTAEDVQFTVFRPKTVRPKEWYDLVAAALLEEKRDTAPEDEPEPLEKVRRKAKKILGAQMADYKEVTRDTTQAVPHGGEITFLFDMDQVEFNPARCTFQWLEDEHTVNVRMRASQTLDGQTATGQMSVFLGAILLADVPLKIKVDSRFVPKAETPDSEPVSARPYRKIFASYSHRDLMIVEQFEHFAEASGDRYLRDWKDLRAGENWDSRLMQLIDEADMFQLFWSYHSMESEFVRREWEYALGLGRPNFVRPVYWEQPFPRRPGLPTADLGRLHFHRLSSGGPPHLPCPSEQAFAEQPKEITNSIGMKLVLIPKGTFTMGSPVGETGRIDHEAQHQVTISKEFFLGVTEVTQSQYEKVMGTNPSLFHGQNVGNADSSKCPVEQVSWEDAVAFCKRLSELSEERKEGRVYRLPTEAEWEYACRAGSTTRYCFGDDPAQLPEYAWFWDEDDISTPHTHSVGQKKPNAWGLYDMHGNVWEWCQDWYGEYPEGVVMDPRGPHTGSFRVCRGGSWRIPAAYCRTALRYGYQPYDRFNDLGFRVAAVVPASLASQADQARQASGAKRGGG